MQIRTLSALVVVSLLAACGGDDGTTGTPDTGTGDTAVDSGDTTVEDATPDTAADVTDTAPDTADAAPEVEDTAPEVEDTAPDVADAAPDTAPDTTPDADGDAGVDAPEDVDPGPTTCETSLECDEGYTCIADICRIALGGRVLAENNFSIAEPEELTGVFDLIKAFAVNVKFVVLDGSSSLVNASEVFVTFGSADIVTSAAEPVELRWQFEDFETPVRFTPTVPAEGETASVASWTSDEFTFPLRANVEASFGSSGTVRANIGFEIVRVRITIEVATDGTADASLVGIATRAEVETRVMGTIEEISSFAPLLCSVRGYTPDDGIWNLSDIFDCNETPMDVDLDGDGTMDAYNVRILTSMIPALLLAPE
jgi:hypothetical protein